MRSVSPAVNADARRRRPRCELCAVSCACSAPSNVPDLPEDLLTAPPCARAASTGTGADEHAPRAPLQIPSGRLISFSEGPLVTLECVELRRPRRAQNRLLSPVCMSMAALHLQGRRSVLRISSRHARRHALLHALLFLLSLSSICVLAPPAAMEPRRTPQPLLSPLPPSPPSLTRGRTRPGPH